MNKTATNSIQTKSEQAGANNAKLDEIISEAITKAGFSDKKSAGNALTKAEESKATREEKMDSATSGNPEINIPIDWPEEDKKLFLALPDEAKDLVLKQYKNFQAGYTKKSQELSETAKFAENIKKALEPHREILREKGISDIEAVKELIQMYSNFRQNPNATIAKLSGQLPNVTHNSLEQKLEYLVAQRIAPLEKQLKEYQIKNRQDEEQAFFKTTDNDGTSLYPHYEKLQPKIRQLLDYRLADNLADAYQQAVWSDKDLREEIINQEKETLLNKLDKERQEAIIKAKKANTKTNKGFNPIKSSYQPSDLDSIISDAIVKAGF